MTRMASSTLSRRSLLSGLGAGCVLLSPFVRYRSAWAAPAQSGNLLIFYTPNGHMRTQFDGITPGTSFTLQPSLAPLQPYQSDIAVVRGLCLRSPTVISSHEDICRILTCVSGPDKYTAYGPSIDQSIGMAINQRPLVVAVDPFRDQPHWRTLLSWRASAVNEPFVKDFNAIFLDLFGGMAGAQTATQMAALARTQQRNQSILDLVKSDIATFRTRVNSHDRIQLDTYLDSLRAVEQKVAQQSGSASATVCAKDPLQARITALPVAPTQADDKSAPGVADQLQARGELHMDMIATAFACGTRRIATIQWQGSSEGYDPAANMGSPIHHSVSHYQFGSSSAARWAAIDLWYANRFAYAIKALKTLGILDRTIIAWVSEISQEHNQNDMVIVLAGGQSLGMKMGQYVHYPFIGKETDLANAARNPQNKSLSDLWVTVQQAMGVQQNTFGDAMWNAGPLTDLR
jgi:hypothetical protein